MDRVVVNGKDCRGTRSGSWWTEPLDFLSRHEAGVVSLRTLCSHHVGKLSLQNTGVRRSTVGNEKLGLRSRLRSEMHRSFYVLVVWEFQGWGIRESIWLLGTKTRCSGVLHDSLWLNHTETTRLREFWRLQSWESCLFCHFNLVPYLGIDISHIHIEAFRVTLKKYMYIYDQQHKGNLKLEIFHPHSVCDSFSWARLSEALMYAVS